MRGKGWIAGLILLGGMGLGMISWPVTGPVNWWLSRFVDEESTWGLSFAEVRWIPFKNRVELRDLKIQVPGGGRMHLVRVFATPHPFSLLGGSLVTHCRIREGRIDPGSWGIRKPPLVEILSADPVAHEGYAILQIELHRILFHTLTLSGPLLQVQAEGWLEEGSQAHLKMNGTLARKLLQQMNLIDPEGPAGPLWEPFQCNLDGALSHPEVSFASNFLSISFKNRGEY